VKQTNQYGHIARHRGWWYSATVSAWALTVRSGGATGEASRTVDTNTRPGRAFEPSLKQAEADR